MRLSDNLSKASWSLADRVLFIVYGFVWLIQVNAIAKEEFGVFTFFNAAFIILYTLSDGYILQAVVRFGVDEKRRDEVVAYTLLIHAVYMALASLAVWAMRAWLATALHEPRYIDVLTMMPLLCLLTIPRTFGAKYFQMLIRTREIFFIDAAFFGTMAAVTIFKVYHHSLHTANDVVGINIIGAAAGSLMAAALMLPRIKFQFRTDRSFLRAMASFGFYQGSAVLTALFQQQADVIIIQYFTNTIQVANYNSAKTFYRAFEAVRDAVTMVVYPVVARLHTQHRWNELRIVIEKLMSFVLISMIPVVLLCEIGGSQFVFHLVFGAKYNESIPIFNILALFGILLPFTLNFAVLTGLGEARSILHIVVVSSAVSLASNFILVPYFHAIGAAMSLILSSIVSGALATRMMRKSVPFEWRALLRGIEDGTQFVKRTLKRSG